MVGKVVQNSATTVPTSLQGSPALPPPIWTNSIPDSDDDISSELDANEWSSEIPPRLLRWGSFENLREIYEIAIENSTPLPPLPIAPSWSSVPPPSLPAQLEKGPLNHAAYVTMGSGDDNSILPKPDHSVINHLAASPIKGGFLSVGVTTRYKRKVSQRFSCRN